jgi:L-rhamnose isomerase
VRKALLQALLEPRATLLAAEGRFDATERLALLEEQKSMPWPAVWEHYCLSRNVPRGIEWLSRVRAYEKDVLSKRTGAQLTHR